MFPKLKELDTQRQMIDLFKGYNHNLRIGEGEFFDMKNMTSDHYPVLAPRGPRAVCRSDVPEDALLFKGKLCYVNEDGDFRMVHMDSDSHVSAVRMNLTHGEGDFPKKLIPVGDYVIILPDKRYIHMGNLTHGYIDNIKTITSNVEFSLCSVTGEDYKDAAVASTAPENPGDQALWIDTSTVPHCLKRYSGTMEMWVTIPTTYVKLSAMGIGTGFKKFDGITISGIQNEAIQSLNGAAVVQEVGLHYIIITGIIDQVTTHTAEEGAITIARKMPDMDFIVQHENRLWGCRYGKNEAGDIINEIYASKLGDVTNWNCFMGLSTDSYAASCGTEGPFTGAITHLGHPLFFKDNCLHKVYGSYPANFRIQVTDCRGVQEGCGGSLAIVNETLFYKSRSGVCAYDGSMPVEVSYALGSEYYTEAVAGSHGSKYYISMKDAAGDYHLFVYDAAKGMWHREDDLKVGRFSSYKDRIYALDQNTGNVLAINGSDGTEKVRWMAQTGIIGTDMPDMKYIARLTVRMSLSLGARVRFLVQYDSMGGWEHLGTTVGMNLRSFSIPIRPRRCDHLRLRIEGEGDARLFSITKTIERGSEIS